MAKPAPHQPALAALTARQAAFVEEFLKDLNATQACIRVGYAPANAHAQGYRNLKNPRVRLAIDTLKAKRIASSDVTSDYVLKKITKIVEDADEAKDRGTALRGLELIARHLGMFIERTEISGKDGEAIRYENAKQDADAFTSAITSLTKRARAAGLSVVPDEAATG